MKEKTHLSSAESCNVSLTNAICVSVRFCARTAAPQLALMSRTDDISLIVREPALLRPPFLLLGGEEELETGCLSSFICEFGKRGGGGGVLAADGKGPQLIDAGRQVKIPRGLSNRVVRNVIWLKQLSHLLGQDGNWRGVVFPSVGILRVLPRTKKRTFPSLSCP